MSAHFCQRTPERPNINHNWRRVRQADQQAKPFSQVFTYFPVFFGPRKPFFGILPENAFSCNFSVNFVVHEKNDACPGVALRNHTAHTPSPLLIQLSYCFGRGPSELRLQDVLSGTPLSEHYARQREWKEVFMMKRPFANCGADKATFLLISHPKSVCFPRKKAARSTRQPVHQNLRKRPKCGPRVSLTGYSGRCAEIGPGNTKIGTGWSPKSAFVNKLYQIFHPILCGFFEILSW